MFNPNVTVNATMMNRSPMIRGQVLIENSVISSFLQKLRDGSYVFGYWSGYGSRIIKNCGVEGLSVIKIKSLSGETNYQFNPWVFSVH
jgi:hypothetical protein